MWQNIFLVSSNVFEICKSNGSNHKFFENIHATTDWVNIFLHKQPLIFRKQIGID